MVSVEAGGTPVGFVMIADEALTTSARQGDGSPIGFYERYGFERTGEGFDGEVLLRLRLVSTRS